MFPTTGEQRTDLRREVKERDVTACGTGNGGHGNDTLPHCQLVSERQEQGFGVKKGDSWYVFSVVVIY